MDPSDPAYAGQKDYGPALLTIYDWWVLRFMTRAIWRSPTPPYLDTYRDLIGERHLDIGPGSGYFLDEGAPIGTRITLLDPNPYVLEFCSKRLSRFDPVALEADALKPLPVDGPFDSVAMSFVLHCMPGPIHTKATAVRNAASVLTSDGVLFGGTVLGLDADHNAAARSVLRVANRQGTFDNLTDAVGGLEEILGESFEETQVQTQHSVAFFVARGPKQLGLD